MDRASERTSDSRAETHSACCGSARRETSWPMQAAPHSLPLAQTADRLLGLLGAQAASHWTATGLFVSASSAPLDSDPAGSAPRQMREAAPHDS